jgi:hypothetical protein
MKASLLYLTLTFLLTLTTLQAENNHIKPMHIPKDTTPKPESIHINPNKWYMDAGGGYFPRSNNSSWAGQLSAGYRITPTIALGIGGAYWGRINLYERSALGMGIQYRQTLWNYFIAKAEMGYVLKPYLNNDQLNRKLEYAPKSSTPLYYKFDLNWRIQHYLTLGVSACQTANLKFRSPLPDATIILDNWRINAFTIQLEHV